MSAHRHRLTPLLLLAALASGQGLAAEPLGRLFFTPERRAALDRQRLLDVQEVQSLEGASIRLDGVVRRSSGRTTVWLNGRPVHENAATAGVAVTVSPRDPGQARVTPDDGTSASLKVGEAISRATRETSDGLGGGRVLVGRPPGK